MRWFSSDDISDLVSMSDAIEAVESALKNGYDPAGDPQRGIVETSRGQLLLMPAEYGAALGVKISSVAPKNPEIGLPRIQAIYLLMDSATMTPIALFEGTALTSLRTPAVSAAAAKQLARPDASHMVVFGAGPQARSHIEAMSAIRPIASVTIVASVQPKADAIVSYATSLGLEAHSVLTVNATEIDDAIARADLIVCATSSRAPVFNGRKVKDGACVVAIGSHEPGAREVEGHLVGRSLVVVEDRATALREAGDVIIAIAEGFLEARSLVSLADLINDPTAHIDPTRPSLFKSSGMAWEDLIVAERVFLGAR